MNGVWNDLSVCYPLESSLTRVFQTNITLLQNIIYSSDVCENRDESDTAFGA